MRGILNIDIKFLLEATFIFFLVFFTLGERWSEPKHPKRHFIVGFLLSILWTFWFFLAGFLILLLVALV